MHDPKFEKDVQQKMEELSLPPSDAVWENVEREIRKEKKRRVVPFFWLFALTGCVLTGGYYFISRENKTIIARAGTAKTGTAAERTTPAKNEAVELGGRSVIGAPGVSLSPAGAGRRPENVLPPVEPGGTKNPGGAKSQTETDNPGGAKAPVTIAPGRTKSPDRLKKTDGTKDSEKTDPDELTDTEKERPGINESTGNAPMKAGGTSADDIMDKTVHKPADPSSSEAEKNQTEKKQTEKNPAEKAKDKALTAKANAGKPAAEKDPKNKESRRWKLGVDLKGGVSAVDKTLFNKASVAELSSLARTFAAYPPGWQTYPSTIDPGFSIAAGIVAGKPLSRTIAFSAGLNYHYYSSRVRTGKAYNGSSLSAMPAGSNALYYPSSVTTSGFSAAAAYSVGSDGVHVNRYHLAELPVSLRWQFMKIGKLPLFWEAGAILSRLINTNALHYDGTLAVYYKDNSLFNKTQLSGSTALMIGLPVSGRRLMAGPEFQYGFTNLLKDNTGVSQHLLFGGVRLSMELGTIGKTKKGN